jgi:hypothetical protein
MNAGEKLKLKEDNEFLFNNLCMVMDEKTMMKIQVHDGDGWAAWQQVKGIFERKDFLYSINLRRELSNMKLTDMKDMDTYLTDISTLVKRIKASGGSTLPDLDVIAYIFQGLPASLETWIYTKGDG